MSYRLEKYIIILLLHTRTTEAELSTHTAPEVRSIVSWNKIQDPCRSRRHRNHANIASQSFPNFSTSVDS